MPEAAVPEEAVPEEAVPEGTVSEGVPPHPSSESMEKITPPPWLSLLDRPSEGGASVVSSDERECRLSAAFVASASTLAALLEDADEGGAPMPLTHVSADELSRLVCVFEAGACTERAAEVFAQLSSPEVAGCVRAAAFLGLDDVRKAAVSQLAATLRGMSVDDIRAATCAADGVDEVSEDQRAAIDGMFLIPSLDGLRAVGAALPDAGHGDSDGLIDVLGLDFNSVLELTACLDLRDLPTFAKASRSACSLLFDPHRQREKDVFMFWSAVFQQKHSTLADMFAAPLGSQDDGAEAWEARTVQMFGLWNVLCWLEDQETVETAWVWSWLRQQALTAGSPPTGILTNVPSNLISSVVYILATRKKTSSTSPDPAAACCGLAEEAMQCATDASSRRLASIISRLEAGANGPEPEPEPELETGTGAGAEMEPASHGAAALPAVLFAGSVLRPPVTEELEGEWQRVAVAHAEVGGMFAYLDTHYMKKLGGSLAGMAAQSREGSDLWQAFLRAGFVPPPAPEPEAEVDLEAEVVLVFSREETMQVTVSQLTDCESLMPQVQQAQRALVMAGGKGQQLPRVMLSGCSKVSMMKVLEFSAGLRRMADAADDDRTAFVRAYLTALEPQPQLPLLFQTMTAANQVGFKVLLDELCKFVAEMIACRTPNEILDYFNVTKDATWEEEQELIATHSWIDPEGLIAKDRERRLAEKANEQA